MLQELSPPPPITGYSNLGAALAQGANDYRLRSQQLEDIGSSRTYETAENTRRNQQELQNRLTLQKEGNREAGIQILINEGLLNAADRDNPDAQNQARARFQELGLDRNYAELFNTVNPRTGAALLTHDQATDLAAVRSARNELSAIKGAVGARTAQTNLLEDEAKRQTLIGGQAEADRQLAEDKALNDQVAVLNTELSRPTPAVTQSDILSRAREMWLIANPGKKAPTDTSKLVNEIGAATKELQDARLLDAQERHGQINQQIALIKQQQIANAQVRAKSGSQGFYASPTAAAPAPGSLLTPDSVKMPTVAPAGSGLSFLDKFKSVQNPGDATSPPPAPNTLIDNPTNNPVIAAGNQAMQDQGKVALQTAYNQAIQDRDSIDQQLTSTATPFAANAGTDPTSRVLMAVSDPGPIGRAQTTSDLLKQRAAADAKVKALQVQLQGAVPAAVTAPVINTPTSSTPTPAFATPPLSAPPTGQWWQASQPQ